jgi:hypothetical protein
LRLLVRTSKRKAARDVAALASRILGTTARAEELYPAKPGKPSPTTRTDEFLVRVRVAPNAALPDNAFDLAHRVRDDSRGVFAWVEPDLPQQPRQGFDDAPPLPAGRETPVAASSNLCLEHVTPPDDHYWHLREMRVPEAWAFSKAKAAAEAGAGIRIGHLDTGWTDHPELKPSLDLNGQFDFVDNDPIAHDELASGNPFHGSRTGSVIASRFTPPIPSKTDPFPKTPAGQGLSGTAPAASLVPIRVVKSVIIFFNGDVARGINHARQNNCHVISMSLGGVAGPSLHDAVRRAVDANIIVCAAAGNCVGFVVAPAVFAESIAVAAVNAQLKPWKGSSRGSAVDICAPGAQVWTAARPTPLEPGAVNQGEGTSFAVAGIAGIAALWLAHHGRAALLQRYANGPKLQDVFRHLLRVTARDIGLPKNEFGPGLVNAEALLGQPLPKASDVVAPVAAGISVEDVFSDVLAGVQLEKRRGPVAAGPGRVTPERELLAQEFAQICFDHPNAYMAFRRGRLLAAAAPPATDADRHELLDLDGVAKYASTRLRERLASG